MAKLRKEVGVRENLTGKVVRSRLMEVGHVDRMERNG